MEHDLGTISREQRDALSAAIQTHDFLHRLVRAIDQLQRVVFHAADGVDFRQAPRVAEQILIAEIVKRHRGEIDGVYRALREREKAGKPWQAAIQDLAAYLHSYYTTPLGIVMRRDLFGDEAAFLSPEAIEWVRDTAAPT